LISIGRLREISSHLVDFLCTAVNFLNASQLREKVFQGAQKKEASRVFRRKPLKSTVLQLTVCLVHKINEDERLDDHLRSWHKPDGPEPHFPPRD
jgi:hypothetical protein